MSNSEDLKKKSEEGIKPASLKILQDPSFSGLKQNKKTKVFVPNLNVTRNKNKSSGSASPNLTNNKKHNERNRKDRKNQNHQNGPNIIKSGGVFSEGMGSGQKSVTRDHFGKSTGSTGSSAIIVRKHTNNDTDSIRKNHFETGTIKKHLDDEAMTEQESVNFSKIKEFDAPIKLPMIDGGYISKPKKKGIDIAIKKEKDITDFENEVPEVKNDIDLTVKQENFIPIPEFKNDVLEDTDLVNLLRRDQPTIIMLQFPIHLPGLNTNTDDDSPHKSQEQESESEKSQKSRCRLSELREGRIGKLRIHRSGNVTLALGNTVLNVSIGTSSAFYEEVMSVSADDYSKSASIVSISPLVYKMIVCPDWENLLKDVS